VGCYLLNTLLAVPLLYFMVLIVWNTLPYFSFSSADPFFLERPIAYRSPVWRVMFYLHITGGLVILFAPILQFSQTMLQKFPAVHRRMGNIYLHTTLWLAVPTGMYLALYAKGGIWGALLFSLMGVVHFYFTWAGWRTLRGRNANMKKHAAWMIRSYLMALAAVSFRLFHVGLMVIGVRDFYTHALWLSLITNLFIAELLVGLTLKRKNRT
jgi:hypothetical protein